MSIGEHSFYAAVPTLKFVTPGEMSMTETAEQYKNRLHSFLAGSDPLAIMEDTPYRLQQLLRDRTAAELDQSRGAGTWSARQVLCHLADAEMVLGYRARTALASSGEPLQSFEQDLWASERPYAGVDIELALRTFTAIRAWNLDLFTRLGDGQLDRYGVHSVRGRESIRDMVRLYGGHDLNHLQQIEQILEQPARLVGASTE
ncbi:MAG: DinB family protein [Acidobacteriota bacterium]